MGERGSTFRQRIEADKEGFLAHLEGLRREHLEMAQHATTKRQREWENGIAEGLGIAVRAVEAWGNAPSSAASDQSPYVGAVLDTLGRVEHFDSMSDPLVVGVLRAHLEARRQDDPAWAFIVDSPAVAHWRLQGVSDSPSVGRVQLECYKSSPTEADRELQARVNAALLAVAPVPR